jgi:hypothetical protein
MLRSGVNGIIKVYERIVLPRGRDFVESALDFWVTSQSHHQQELLVVDFVDAFMNLRVKDSEDCNLIVTDGRGRFLAYQSVPFGLASAPLLWERVAAWLGRCAQAVSSPKRLRTQIRG